MTNAHVIGEGIEDAITPGEAFVMFELECALEEKPVSHRVVPPVLFSSPPGDPGVTAANKLDVAVVKLETWPKNGIALRTNDNLPILGHKSVSTTNRLDMQDPVRLADIVARTI